MGIPNHYDTLGLLSTADDVVIKAAYKALAQKHHPDKHKTHKELHTQRMAELNAAFAALGTKAKRKAYDERLAKAAPAPAPARHAPQPAPEAAPTPPKKKSNPHAKVIEDLSSNAMDEMLVVELFEKLFACRVTIQNGWVNTYSFTDAGKKVSVDFLTLKTRIIHRLTSE
jgi:curved DNA-binding protein CbpA